MRHFLTPGPVATLALRMGQTPPAAVLIPRSGHTPGLQARRRGAALSAIALAAVAARTDHYLTATAVTVEQAGRIAHRQLLPTCAGSSPNSGRYLPPAPTTPGARGAALVQDLPGRCQCRTTFNGTDPVDQSPTRVTPRRTRGLPLPACPPTAPLRHPEETSSSPPSTAITRAIRQLPAGFHRRPHSSPGCHGYPADRPRYFRCPACRSSGVHLGVEYAQISPP
jgi:hypothetical protein